MNDNLAYLSKSTNQNNLCFEMCTAEILAVIGHNVDTNFKWLENVSDQTNHEMPSCHENPNFIKNTKNTSITVDISLHGRK